MMRSVHSLFGALALVCVLFSPAAARPLEAERQAGVVGDQADGYLGIVGNAPPTVQQEVASINAERRVLYVKMAAEKGVSVDAVAAIFGEQLFQQTPSGQYFRDATGAWKLKP